LKVEGCLKLEAIDFASKCEAFLTPPYFSQKRLPAFSAKIKPSVKIKPLVKYNLGKNIDETNTCT
jgi:hypothetical protein